MIATGLVCGIVAASAQTAPTAPRKTNESNAEAMELLRRVIAEQQKNPDKIIRIPGLTNAVPVKATKADLEKQYLDGQLTAKQYQKALDQLEKDEQKQAAESEKRRKREAQQAAKSAPPTVKKPADETKPIAVSATPPAIATNLPVVPVELTPEQKKLAEVEARIDEMLRQKAERERTALTNSIAPANPVAKTPQTKRQRMDALLKQMIDGKISEGDYAAQRNKILAEPD